MPVTAVCPGSFDPVTYGHIDVIERAARHVDVLVVACSSNVSKQALLGIDTRVELVRAVTEHLDTVEVVAFGGLIVDFCRQRGAHLLVKGLRGSGDVEYELQMAQMNARLAGVETLFLSTSPVYSFVSSSLVKEVARFGGDISAFVPPIVAKRLRERLGQPDQPADPSEA